MSEYDQLVALCEKMGAESSQAATMARQLMKRADQLSIARNIPRIDAMKQLLEVLVRGRNGEGPPEATV